MGEKVTSIFERAIDVFGRKDDMSDNRDDGTVLWQVDVDMMDVLFTSLMEYLQLDNAYNIFVLNPRRNGKRVKYGYRQGLSEREINFLRENKEVQSKILHSGRASESILALEKMTRPLYAKHPMAKFSWTVTEDTETVEWYNRCLDVLNNVEKVSQGKDMAEDVQNKVMQFLNGRNGELKLRFERVKSWAV